MFNAIQWTFPIQKHLIYNSCWYTFVILEARDTFIDVIDTTQLNHKGSNNIHTLIMITFTHVTLDYNEKMCINLCGDNLNLHKESNSTSLNVWFLVCTYILWRNCYMTYDVLFIMCQYPYIDEGASIILLFFFLSCDTLM